MNSILTTQRIPLSLEARKGKLPPLFYETLRDYDWLPTREEVGLSQPSKRGITVDYSGVEWDGEQFRGTPLVGIGVGRPTRPVKTPRKPIQLVVETSQLRIVDIMAEGNKGRYGSIEDFFNHEVSSSQGNGKTALSLKCYSTILMLARYADAGLMTSWMSRNNIHLTSWVALGYNNMNSEEEFGQKVEYGWQKVLYKIGNLYRQIDNWEREGVLTSMKDTEYTEHRVSMIRVGFDDASSDMQTFENKEILCVNQVTLPGGPQWGSLGEDQVLRLNGGGELKLQHYDVVLIADKAGRYSYKDFTRFHELVK